MSFKAVVLSLIIGVSAFPVQPARAGLPFVVADDNADFSQYAPQPNHSWSANNGGYGYGLWTTLGGASGGGTFMEGLGVNGRQVDGSYSFALFGGSGSFAISRPLSNSIALGEFDITTRFDLGGSGPNLFSIRSGNNTSSFGSGELLSFGIVNGNQLDYTDSTGFHLLSSGEARGPIWSWSIDFDAATGTYSASVTNLGGGFSAVFSGNLQPNGASVGSFAAINSSSGGGQNLVFDSPMFSVPEPSTTSLLLLGMAGWLWARRRQS